MDHGERLVLRMELSRLLLKIQIALGLWVCTDASIFQARRGFQIIPVGVRYSS